MNFKMSDILNRKEDQSHDKARRLIKASVQDEMENLEFHLHSDSNKKIHIFKHILQQPHLKDRKVEPYNFVDLDLA